PAPAQPSRTARTAPGGPPQRGARLAQGGAPPLGGLEPLGGLPAGGHGRPSQPNTAGSPRARAAIRSPRGTLKQPATASRSPPTVPRSASGTACRAHSAASACSAPGATSATARAGDSLNSIVNGSPGRLTRQPAAPRTQHSASATARPPSDRSCAAAS